MAQSNAQAEQNFFELARTNMVKGQLMTNNVSDHRILEAMLEVPREDFIDGKWRKLAYLDDHLPLVHKRFILQPETFARLVQAAEIKSTETVLDIGCGSGYSSIIISRLARDVIGLESSQTLQLKAASQIARMNVGNVTIKLGDLLTGYSKAAPYDIIFVNGALDSWPMTLLAQLKDTGRLVMVLEDKISKQHKAVMLTKILGTREIFQKELFDAWAHRL
jgi:protein-L-isoaspartate(D-aspartate) O-methyltransferase